MKKLSLFPLCFLLFFACRQSSDIKDGAIPGYDAKVPSLKEAYKDYFPIGTAIISGLLDSTDEKLISKHFSSLTPENDMKWANIHPAEDKYVWEPVDKIVNYAQANHMKVRGHCFIWHQAMPDWLFVDKGKPVSKEKLLQRLHDHINAVMQRYKGKVYCYDVVNEAISDDSAKIFRDDSPWFKILGEDLIVKAFEYAHEADPQAKLFYNEYSTEVPMKRKKIFDMIKRMKEKGVPIHGIGMQSHFAISDTKPSEIVAAIDTFATLGIDVQITELDVSMYRWGIDDSINYTVFPAEKIRQFTDLYNDVFEIFRQKKDKITGVTFWNLADNHTWLDYFPVRNRKNAPLLFDRQLKTKEAFWKVVSFKK